MNMSNTKKAIKKFYLNSKKGKLSARITFPIFYRKVIEWLGENPEEVEEEKTKMFISKEGYSREASSLVIPLKERALILWWGSGYGHFDNQVILCPKPMVGDGIFDNKALKWWQQNTEKVRNYNFEQWEEIVKNK